MSTESIPAVTESTATVPPAVPQPPAPHPDAKTLDKWYWEVRALWEKQSTARGPEAFALLLDLAAMFANTACCACSYPLTREQGDPPRYGDMPDIDQVAREITRHANNLLHLAQKVVEGKKV